MEQGPGPVTPQAQPRRSVLFGVGAVGAAVIADHYLGGSPPPLAVHARDAARLTPARPAWLSAPGNKPTKADWYALRRKLVGHLILPGERAYNPARTMFDPRFNYLAPAAFAYCKTSGDVANCVDFARGFTQLPLRVRSGAHSYEGWSSVNDGLVVDVSDMNSFSVGSNSVTVGSGIDLINFYNGLAAHGRAVPGGSCPTVGIAGLALGGGIGVLARIYGLTSNCIDSLKIVVADGSTLTCNATNPQNDLYWASRGGGGGNFGVATEFTFRTFNLTHLVEFVLGWPWSQAARVVGAWQNWGPHAPNALWSGLRMGSGTGSFPSHIYVVGSYAGSLGACQAQLDKLYGMVGSHPSSGAPVNYTFLQAMLNYAGCAGISVPRCSTPPAGNLPFVPSYAKSDFFSKPLDKAGISALLGAVERLRSVRGAGGGSGSIAFDALQGQAAAINKQSTAWVHRDALWGVQYYTSWNWPGNASGRANQFNWLNSAYASVHPHADGEAYQNYVDSALKNWQHAYYGVNYTHLQEIKTKYDKKKLFNFPQAIQPTSATACSDDC
jgi:FAD binding domain/Berberine and berberine like